VGVPLPACTFIANARRRSFTAKQRLDFISRRTATSAPSYLGKPTRRARSVRSFDNNADIGNAPEGDLGARFDPQIVAKALWNRHATIFVTFDGIADLS
jgi:hypothetical protein